MRVYVKMPGALVDELKALVEETNRIGGIGGEIVQACWRHVQRPPVEGPKQVERLSKEEEMRTLQARGMPRELYNKMREIAKRMRRSLNTEIVRACYRHVRSRPILVEIIPPLIADEEIAYAPRKAGRKPLDVRKCKRAIQIEGGMKDASDTMGTGEAEMVSEMA